MIISCPHCRAQFKLKSEPDRTKSLRLKCSKCGQSSIIKLEKQAGQQAVVLIAHDDMRVVNIIKKILEKVAPSIIAVHDGHEALTRIGEQRPDVAIIDVALPGIFGFELCERIKNSPGLKDTRVILVASIYDRTRYKRKPQNLYGADDYIEKHHIPDKLFQKVSELLSHKLGSVDLRAAHRPESLPSDQLKDNRIILSEKREQAREVPPAAVTAPPPPPPPTSVAETVQREQEIERQREEIQQHLHDQLGAIPVVEERARKLARLIVSDIALYNQETIADVTINNYREQLKMDVDEGIRYLNAKLPDVASRSQEFIHEAFRDLLEKKPGAKRG